MPWAGALSNLLLLSELAYTRLHTLWCRSCQEQSSSLPGGSAQPNHLPTCASDSIYNQNTAPQRQALPFKTCNTVSMEINSSVTCFSVLSPDKSDLQMLSLLTEEIKKKKALLGLSYYTSKFSLDKAKPALLISNLRQCPQVFLRRKKPEWK